MKQCPFCHAEIETDASNCKFCGVPLKSSYTTMETTNTRPPIKGEITLGSKHINLESSLKVSATERTAVESAPPKRSIGVTVFAWFIIIQGIIIALIPAVYAIKKIQDQPIVLTSNFAIPGLFGGSLLILTLALYFGIRLLLLKKAVLRETALLTILGIIAGLALIVYGMGKSKFVGILILIFYSTLLYFLTRHKVKQQFK